MTLATPSRVPEIRAMVWERTQQIRTERYGAFRPYPEGTLCSESA